MLFSHYLLAIFHNLVVDNVVPLLSLGYVVTAQVFKFWNLAQHQQMLAT